MGMPAMRVVDMVIMAAGMMVVVVMMVVVMIVRGMIVMVLRRCGVRRNRRKLWPGSAVE
jgi:hypothetical protein